MARGVFTASTPLTTFDLNDLFDKPRCAAHTGEDLVTIPNSENITVPLDYEHFDVGGLHSTSSNSGRITIPAGCAGVYLLEGVVEWTLNTTGVRLAWMYLNGLSLIARSNEVQISAFPTNRLAAIYSLDVGDFVEIVANQNSGGDLDVNKARLSAMWLRPTP